MKVETIISEINNLLKETKEELVRQETIDLQAAKNEGKIRNMAGGRNVAMLKRILKHLKKALPK